MVTILQVDHFGYKQRELTYLNIAKKHIKALLSSHVNRLFRVFRCEPNAGDQ